MKTQFILASALAIASFASAATFHWNGSEDTEGRVLTGLDDGSEKSGYWYDYNDSNDGGSSGFTFPADVTKNEWDNFYGPLCEAYGGLKGTVSLGAGYDYPYAGIGFNVTGEDQLGGDITSWGGICLTYQSTLGFGIELGVENEKTVTEYNNYKATVPKAASMTVTSFTWEKFKQGTGWGKIVDQPEVLAKTAAIKLKFEGTAGTTGDFIIKQIGSNDICTPDAFHGARVAPSSVKAQLSGRTLSFSGINNVAKAEVINLQGQVVANTSVSKASAMDLSKLDAGIYMVRVSGKTVNMSQKIVLK